jgi:hypothetical protein
MKKKIAVIGCGSAGVQSLCQMLVWTDENHEITSIYNPSIPTIGVGESVNPAFVEALELGADFSFYDDLDKIDGTMKMGAKYKKWREEDLFIPLIQGRIAMHFSTFKIVDFVMPKLRERWAGKLKEVHGNVDNVDNLEDRVDLTIDGKVYSYDYVIDCRGTPKDFTDYTMTELPINSCLVHYVQEPLGGTEWLYTGHIATPDGWMFEVPLSTQVSYGYLYNDRLTDETLALDNFAKELNVPVDQLDYKKYTFKSYYSRKVLNGRVVNNGNKAYFLEPMFANALWAYNFVAMSFMDYMRGKLTEDEVNSKFVEAAQQVEEMIWFKYHGGSTYDTPFWQDIVPLAKEKVKNGANFNRVRAGLQEMNRNRDWGTIHQNLRWVYNALNLAMIDKAFGYNYFQ